MSHDDDLYGGYDAGSNPLAATGLFAQQGMEAAVPGTALGYGAAPGTAMRTAVPGTASVRMGTASQSIDNGGRPMTSNRGAGFTSGPRGRLDPNSASRASGSMSGVIAKKTEASAEETARDMEKKVHSLMEDSAMLRKKADSSTALEKALDCKKRERALVKYRDANGMADQQNVDLTFGVDFILAEMYHENKNYSEALNAYTAIVKNKALPQSGRLRVNMGNIYFEQKNFTSAIKMYRIALDQIPQTAKEVRFKIMRNIGLAFVRMGQYQDAFQSFTNVMDHSPDHQTGYNLVVCSFAIGDREAMKRSFQRLIEVPLAEGEEDPDDEVNEEDDVHQAMQDDGLKDDLRKRSNYRTRLVVNAAKLISEKIEKSGFIAGFDWCAEQLRQSDTYARLMNEVELAKASKFLANKEFGHAVNVFKEFEKRAPRAQARAATNLSFLYFLEGQIDQADKYSELALKSDRYNARAFVNKGNILMERGDLDGAKTMYQEAAGIEPYCVEAVFNLGLVYLRLDELHFALAAFKKLHNMLPDNVEFIYQVANCFDRMEDFKNAVKWLELLSSLVPNDPGALAKLGAIHARFDDEAKALHYYQESHRVFPVNMDVISWLGAFHVKNEVYERAIPYFDLASKVQPSEVKWALMVASCYRRINAHPQALAKYKEIHLRFPDNAECLRYLVHLCTESGRREDAQEYMTKLKKVDRQQVAEATAAATQMAARLQQQPVNDGYADGSQAGLDLSQNKAGKKIVMGDGKRDDDWGNEELGEDLLPGV